METTNANANADIKQSVDNKQSTQTSTTLSFPRDISRKVSIKRKPKIASIPGVDPKEAKLKIGSSFKGSSINRGLTLEEETRFLSNIMGISTESQNWETETHNYWANISKEIPADGIELEVGLVYKNKEDYEHDQKQIINDKFKAAVNLKGFPINVADYILWRYCLVYNLVANDFSEAYNSPNIEFYLFNKDKETKDKKVLQNQKHIAFKLLMSNMSDREWVDCMLRVFIASDKTSNVFLKDLPVTSNDEKDLLLEDYMNKVPDRFVTLGNDKNLVVRSFIEQAIVVGKLSRIPNTSTIMMDGSSIGDTTEQAINYLTDKKNGSVYATLKAQVNLMP